MLMITHILTHNIIHIHHYTVSTKLLFSQMHTNCSRVQVQPLIAFFVAQNKQLSVPSWVCALVFKISRMRISCGRDGEGVVARKGGDKWTVYVEGIEKHHHASTNKRVGAMRQLHLNSRHARYESRSNWNVVTSWTDNVWWSGNKEGKPDISVRTENSILQHLKFNGSFFQVLLSDAWDMKMSE